MLTLKLRWVQEPNKSQERCRQSYLHHAGAGGGCRKCHLAWDNLPSRTAALCEGNATDLGGLVPDLAPRDQNETYCSCSRLPALKHRAAPGGCCSILRASVPPGEPGRLRVPWERDGWMASVPCAASEWKRPGKDFLLVKWTIPGQKSSSPRLLDAHPSPAAANRAGKKGGDLTARRWCSIQTQRFENHSLRSSHHSFKAFEWQLSPLPSPILSSVWGHRSFSLLFAIPNPLRISKSEVEKSPSSALLGNATQQRNGDDH